MGGVGGGRGRSAGGSSGGGAERAGEEGACAAAASWHARWHASATSDSGAVADRERWQGAASRVAVGDNAAGRALGRNVRARSGVGRASARAGARALRSRLRDRVGTWIGLVASVGGTAVRASVDLRGGSLLARREDHGNGGGS